MESGVAPLISPADARAMGFQLLVAPLSAVYAATK
jgi:hypothetical protein